MLLRYLKWGTVLAMISTLVTGCTNVDFVYNDTLVKKGFIAKEALDEDEKKSKDNLFYIPRQLGGIKFKDSSAPGGERMFLVKREKSTIIAETQIYQGENNKYFDRAYFSAGASANDYVGFQFRFEDDEKKLFEKAYFTLGANKAKGRVGLELKFVF